MIHKLSSGFGGNVEGKIFDSETKILKLRFSRAVQAKGCVSGMVRGPVCIGQASVGESAEESFALIQSCRPEFWHILAVRDAGVPAA